jgi:hypothetical protein
MANTSLEEAKARRRELIEAICKEADEITRIDRSLPILKSIELEADLLLDWLEDSRYT